VLFVGESESESESEFVFVFVFEGEGACSVRGDAESKVRWHTQRKGDCAC
jgi:hypothetical protein